MLFALLDTCAGGRLCCPLELLPLTFVSPEWFVLAACLLQKYLLAQCKGQCSFRILHANCVGHKIKNTSRSSSGVLGQ